MVRDLLAKGLAHDQAGRLEDAEAAYDQVLNRNPRHPDALPGRAIRLIQKAIQVHPNNAGFHANLAQAFLASHRVDAALAAFRKAGQLDRRNPQFPVGAASCLAMQGHLPEAEAQLRKVTRAHPGYALAWLNLGNAVLVQGRRYRNLASALTDCGKFDNAVIACEPSLARAPQSVELHMMLGNAYVRQGKLTAALKAFRNAARLVPAASAWAATAVASRPSYNFRPDVH